jgi:hypothetical protein
MKKWIALLLILTIALFSACSGEPQPSLSPVDLVAPSPSPSVSVTASPLPSETPAAPSPVKVSFTTGLPFEGEYKPVGVMIENSPAARPQTGMQSADIVYEAIAEGGITRFFCIFNDTLPEIVGPVRSLRVYYMNIQKEWDSIVVHWGGPHNGGDADVYGKASKYIKIRVDGLKGIRIDGKKTKLKLKQYVWRISGGGVHDCRANVKNIQTMYNYTPKERTPWQFDANTAYAASDKFVTKVILPFAGNDNYLWYTYDKEKDVLQRYMSKKPFTDTATKKAIEVKNLIVQYVDYYSLNEGKGRQGMKQTGTGKAAFVIGGKLIKGTWERKNLDSQTIYRDDTGKEIVLRPGNTWVALHPDSKEIKVEYEE